MCKANLTRRTTASKRARKGELDANSQAFLDATLPHLDAVHRVARLFSRDSFSADDLVQETYLRAFTGFANHVGPNTRAWLVTICLNLARSEGRRRSRRVTEVPMTTDDYVAEGTDVHSQVQARLDANAVVDALRQLPDEQRLAIVLMDIAGNTAAEVAEMLACPRGTILARVHRGRRRLAALLSEQGIDYGVF